MTKTRRILHVQTGSGLSGGISGYISGLMQADSLKLFNFTVVVSKGEAENCARYNAANLVEVASTYRPNSFLSYVMELRKIAKTNDIDLMHAHALRAGFAVAWVSWATGIPFIYTNHGLRFTQKTGVLRKMLFRTMEIFVCWRARAIVSVRPHDANILGKFKRDFVTKLRTIRTQIEDTPSTPNAQSTKLPLLIGVGSLIDVKRPDRFLKCVKELTSIHCSIRAQWLGDGYLKQLLIEECNKHSLPIAWRGQVSSSEVRKQIHEASLLLLTSEFEVLPLAVLEAYASSTPVVCIRFDGVDDFVENGKTGIILDAFSQREAANAISALLQDKARLRSMSANARLAFEKYFGEPEVMASQYAELYEKLLNGVPT